MSVKLTAPSWKSERRRSAGLTWVMGTMKLGCVFLRWLFCIGILCAQPAIAHSANFRRDALKHVVSACALAKRATGLSFPCLDVAADNASPAGSYAVIRAPQLRTEVLVVPVDTIAGIEDPALLTASSSHLWEAAWAARRFVADALGQTLPRDAVGLAVNSVAGRSQDQFHIHVDCVDRHVQRLLYADVNRIGSRWRQLPLRLAGETFWARSVASDDLSGINVAALISRGLPSARKSMGRVSVAVVGATLKDGRDGFLLLANDSSRTAEGLLDHSCRAF